MKSIKNLAFPIIAALTLLVNGCIIEEENDYTYILVNESSINITLERVGGYDDNFTSNSVQINAESQFSFHYYDISLPFLTTDSLYFKNNGVILIHNSRVALDNTILDNIALSKELIGHGNLAKLSSMKPGQTAMVLSVAVNHPKDPADAALKRRLLDMGVTRGTRIFVRKVAPLGDPMELHVRGYELTLRKNEAEKVEVSVLEND